MAQATSRRPRLRPLEAVPTDHEGQTMLMLRDPLHLSDAVLLVPMPLVRVLERLDGRHTFTEIRERCRTLHDFDVPEEVYCTMVARLEEAHFLEGEGFDSWSASLQEAFVRAPVRPSFLAEKSYAADPARLRSAIEGFFTSADGPGLPRQASAARTLRGLIAPHIDFQRGGSTFACAYKALAERTDADLFVVLGTAHVPMAHTYVLTRKSFDTPFGVLETDAGFVEALAGGLGVDAFRDEFAHRAEHAIEFQAVFLQYLFAGVRPVRFVPVLVGSFGEFVARGESPRGDEQVEAFVSALKETMAAHHAKGKKICLIASVDLAHVGPQFGDAHPVDAKRLEELAQADDASLRAACRGDAEAFYWSVATDGDARKVCGLAPIYTMLRTLGACEGEVLRYTQWPDPNGVVTFCSAVLV